MYVNDIVLVIAIRSSSSGEQQIIDHRNVSMSNHVMLSLRPPTVFMLQKPQKYDFFKNC